MNINELIDVMKLGGEGSQHPQSLPSITTNYLQSLNPSLKSLGGEGSDLQAVATPTLSI